MTPDGTIVRDAFELNRTCFDCRMWLASIVTYIVACGKPAPCSESRRVCCAVSGIGSVRLINLNSLTTKDNIQMLRTARCQ